jgi:uncharacterized membrane protein
LAQCQRQLGRLMIGNVRRLEVGGTRLVGASTRLFAIGAASLGILSLAYGVASLTGRFAPGEMPWRETWIYASGLLVVLAAAGLCHPRTAWPSALVIGAYLSIWALGSLADIRAKPLSFEGWYGFCEASTSLAGAWIVGVASRPMVAPRGVALARRIFAITCLFYGASHFAYIDYTAGMVPGWLPGHRAFAYLTGAAHLAAGLAIIFEIVPRLAAILEAAMMTLFGLLVWAPSFFAHPAPSWAGPAVNQWSELVVTLLLAASAWVVAASFSALPGPLATEERRFKDAR